MEIFLGSKMEKNDEFYFINYCKKNIPNAKIYKMRKEEKSFNLIPELI